MEKGEVASTIKPQQVSPLFGTIYNSVVLVAHATQRVRHSKQWMSGGNVAQQAHNHNFEGFSHPVKSDASGSVLLDYVILDTDGLSCELTPTH
ncbi:retinal guanylyl cyclase 2-like, partial [Hippocampus comes]